MDTLDSNFQQKFNAEILVRPNSEAESRRLETLEQQSKENEECIREMRRLNAKNTEVMERTVGILGHMQTGSNEAQLNDILTKVEELRLSLSANAATAASQDVLNKLDELTAAIAANAQ